MEWQESSQRSLGPPDLGAGSYRLKLPELPLWDATVLVLVWTVGFCSFCCSVCSFGWGL